MSFDRCAVQALPVSSAGRYRQCLNQLTAALRLYSYGGIGERTVEKPKEKKHRHPIGYLCFLAPQTGLEPVTPRLTAACSTD